MGLLLLDGDGGIEGTGAIKGPAPSVSGSGAVVITSAGDIPGPGPGDGSGSGTEIFTGTGAIPGPGPASVDGAGDIQAHLRVSSLVADVTVRATTDTMRVSSLVGDVIDRAMGQLRMSSLLADVITREQEVLLSDESAIGLTWVEFTDRQGDVHVWAKVDLADPIDYYHGFKESRVLKWGTLQRALSDRMGQFEASEFSWTVQDTDRYIRSLQSASETRPFKNRPAVIRMISDAERRLFKRPRTVIRGYINSYRPVASLEYEFNAIDTLTARFASVGQDPAQVPSRTVNGVDFPDCPIDHGGLAVPFIYGDLSDKLETSSVVPGVGAASDKAIGNVTGLMATVVGAGGPNTNRYAVTAMNDAYGSPLSLAPNDHRGETAAVFIDVPGCPLDADLSDTEYVELRWDDMGTNAVNYRVYGRSPGLVKLLNVAEDDGAPVYYDGKRASGVAAVDTPNLSSNPPTTNNTVVSGDPNSIGATLTVDRGIGEVPVIYVGTDNSVGAVPMKTYLVCGHAVKAITGIYRNGIRVPDSDFHDQGYLAPGFPNWPLANSYQDINGRRYTLIYVNSGWIDADATDELTLNVQGIETHGDGTGTLITSVHLQYLHAIVNWILQDYQTGEWLAMPVFEDDGNLPQVDANSFRVSKTLADQRIAGGYPGAGMVGAKGEFVTVRDLVAKFNLSGDCDSAFNRKCQFFISMVPGVVDDEINQITDVLDVQEGSFDINDDLSAHANKIPYAFERDYTGRSSSGWNRHADAVDTGSIENYTTGQISGLSVSPVINLEFIRDEDVADNIASLRLERQTDPPRLATITIGQHGMNYDLGDIIHLTHYGGVGPVGWFNKALRILRHEADPDQFRTTLGVQDVEPFTSE